MTTTQTGFVRHLRTLIAKQTGGAPTDQQLLERFLSQRSEDSFAVLVERHGPMVLGVCRRLLRHAHDAEDVFQATFLVLARKAGSIRKQESVGSFLHGVAYHLAGKLKAKAVRRAQYERDAATPSATDPAEEITWRELRTVLDAELQSLPAQYRSPLVLCHLEGKTQDEAARQLGWSKSTFRRRLDRARDLLARRLTRRGLALSAVLSAPLLAGTSARTAVPSLLAKTTTQVSLAFVTGRGSTALVSAQVAALAGGGTKMKALVALLVLLGMTIGGLVARQALAIKSEAVQSAAPAQAQAAAPPRATPPAHTEATAEIKGCVLDSEGKPLAGAHLFLLSDGSRKKVGAPVRATTDKDGRFRFTARPADFGLQGKGVLTATAKGFGLNWMNVTAQTTGEITLRLVADDKPINGRILDLEGKPIAGVTVEVLYVGKRAEEDDLTSWVKRYTAAMAKGLGFDEAEGMKILNPGGLDVPATVTTGADGRFRLTGYGRERVLHLAIHGPTIEQTRLFALTRTGPDKGWHRGHWGLYGCRFDHLAAPCKPIVGTVRDKRTGKPLAGMTVSVPGPTWSYATTDEQGHYRIIGVGKRKEYTLAAEGMPYFNRTKRNIADTPGLEPLTVNFELEQGIAIRGRLTNQVTGEPVQGRLGYIPSPENPNAKDFTDAFSSAKTAKDGSFTLTAIPGPGLLRVTADDVERFAGADEKAGQMRGGLDTYHAVVAIDPSPKDPKSLTCDIALEPARVLTGSVVDPDGRPLAGTYAAGRPPVIHFDFFQHEKLETASFQVSGIKPGRPRTLVFFHPEKKLGKVLQLQGDETKPLMVRLEPLGALTGRVLDAKGRPWVGLKVTALLGRKAMRGDKSMPKEFHWGYSSWPRLTQRETTTDRDGKFRLDGLVPGLPYDLIASEEGIRPGATYAYRADDRIAESGKTEDLGEWKSKQTPGERSGK